ncbi:MAG: thioredoxin [Clostridia bacterium]
MSNATVVTKSNFESVVMSSDIPVLVDFWATWCGPCQMLSPVINELASEYSGRVSVCKVDIDEEPELTSKFGIMSVPAVFLFKNGKTVATISGARPKSEFVAAINSIL